MRCIEGKDDQFLTAFEATARDCIDDGADIIIAGGQLFGPAFQRHSFFKIPNAGIPVIEVPPAG